jgi:hypothetical protein
MRTTIDLPDALYRHIKARAALQGVPVKTLVGTLLQRGLAAADAPARCLPARSAPPTVEVAEPFPLSAPSNAALFELLEEPDTAR